MEDEVHVWRVALDATERRAAARSALDEVLAGYLDGEVPALDREPGGKPRLADRPGRLAFSLSHSGNLALIAVRAGGRPVGIDIERIRARRNLARLAARWLPADDAEAVAIASPEERETIFYAAWTRWEARVKCTGAGLSGAPPGKEVVAVALEIDPGYAAAVAVDSTAGGGTARNVPIRVCRFDLGRAGSEASEAAGRVAKAAGAKGAKGGSGRA